MIKLKLKTQNGTLHIECKSSWDELTLSEFIQLETVGISALSPLKIFSILTGLEVDILANASGKEVLNNLTGVTSFINSAPKFEDLPPPKTIMIGDKAYKTPLDFEKTMLGQKILLQQIIANNKQDIIKELPNVLAIYLQPVIDGKFKDERLPEVRETLMDSPAIPAYALAQFFFLHSSDLANIGLRKKTQSHVPTQPIAASQSQPKAAV